MVYKGNFISRKYMFSAVMSLERWFKIEFLENKKNIFSELESLPTFFIDTKICGRVPCKVICDTRYHTRTWHFECCSGYSHQTIRNHMLFRKEKPKTINSEYSALDKNDLYHLVVKDEQFFLEKVENVTKEELEEEEMMKNIWQKLKEDEAKEDEKLEEQLASALNELIMKI